MMQTEFLVTLQTKKHDLKSRMTSKTVPENAFMILCLPEQSSMKDDWKRVLGNAIEAEVYNRGGLHKGEVTCDSKHSLSFPY